MAKWINICQIPRLYLSNASSFPTAASANSMAIIGGRSIGTTDPCVLLEPFQATPAVSRLLSRRNSLYRNQDLRHSRLRPVALQPIPSACSLFSSDGVHISVTVGLRRKKLRSLNSSGTVFGTPKFIMSVHSFGEVIAGCAFCAHRWMMPLDSCSTGELEQHGPDRVQKFIGVGDLVENCQASAALTHALT